MTPINMNDAKKASIQVDLELGQMLQWLTRDMPNYREIRRQYLQYSHLLAMKFWNYNRNVHTNRYIC